MNIPIPPQYQIWIGFASQALGIILLITRALMDGYLSVEEISSIGGLFMGGNMLAQNGQKNLTIAATKAQTEVLTGVAQPVKAAELKAPPS